MEETIGECTNLHITYPALALGYLVLIRANRTAETVLEQIGEATETGEPARELAANDIAMSKGGEPIAGIMRFHNALRELLGRRGIRNDVSRYEAIGLGMVEMDASNRGELLDNYPVEESPLRIERFFDTLYLRYDERFVTSAPDLSTITRRLEWAVDSPAFELLALDYVARVVDASE